MSAIACPTPLNFTARSAAADINCMAVATRERFAAFVSFRWQSPSIPPTQNVNSAAFPLLAAGHFSGNIAQIALTTAKSLKQ